MTSIGVAVGVGAGVAADLMLWFAQARAVFSDVTTGTFLTPPGVSS